jgi:hypothetical protein
MSHPQGELASVLGWLGSDDLLMHDMMTSASVHAGTADRALAAEIAEEMCIKAPHTDIGAGTYHRRGILPLNSGIPGATH